MTDRAGRTDLHYAALDGDLARVRELLAGGADPSAADRQDFTPLHFAAQSYAPAVVDVLLEAGADLEHRNQFGNTALFVAVMNSQGRGEVIERLLSAGADPHAENVAGNSPIKTAREIANYDIEQFFGDVGEHS